MSKPFVPKAGTTAECAAFTGLENEVVLDEEKGSLIVHDGVTAGGAHEILPKAKNDEIYSTKLETSEAIDKCLPLSGGSMTGVIKTSVGDFIAKTTNDSYLCLNGGVNSSSGARIVLSGQDREGLEGRFTLVARDANTEKSLTGTPSGSLTWNSKEIITSEGGTITGAIRSSINNALAKPDDTGEIQINGGTSLNHGGSLMVYGYSHSSLAGRATLRACNASGNKYDLCCRPDGRLTWKDSDVLTASSDGWTVSSGNSGWMRNNSTGFTIQWGKNVAANGSVTFPRSFTACYVVLATSLGGNWGYVSNQTNTGFKNSNNSNANYIAIGLS